MGNAVVRLSPPALRPSPGTVRPEALPPARGVVDIRRLLAWAIGYQKAHIAARSASVGELGWLQGGGRSMTSIVAEVGALGYQVDKPTAATPRSFSADPDAEIVFDQVRACLTDWHEYNLVVDHAETDTEPDWKPNASPRAMPERGNAKGGAAYSKHTVDYVVPVWRAKVRDRGSRRLELVEYVGGAPPAGPRWRLERWVHETVLNVTFTPIVWADDPEEICAARALYRVWHAALGKVAAALNADAQGPHGLGRWSQVTHGAPAHPWPVEDDGRLERLMLDIRYGRREVLQQGVEAPNRGRLDRTGLQPIDNPI